MAAAGIMLNWCMSPFKLSASQCAGTDSSANFESHSTRFALHSCWSQPAQYVHARLCRTGNGASSAALRTKPTRSSSYFQHTHLDKYMPFMAGMGYVLSSDLAHAVLGFNQEQNSGRQQAVLEAMQCTLLGWHRVCAD